MSRFWTNMKLTTAAFAAAAPVLSSAAQEPQHMIAGTRLDIVVTGEIVGVPDIASVGAGVVTQSSNAATALSANAGRMAATLAALRKAGVAERDMQTTTVNLSPQYRYADNQPPVITGYQASSRVSVRFRDVATSGRILDALVAAGANQIDGPTLSIDKPEPLLDQAREKAIADAQARAARYARATGLRIKRIVSISEGSSEMPFVRAQYAPMAVRSKAADTEIAPGEQKIAVSLSVTFELQ